MSTTRKLIADYVAEWCSRCYFDGIPEEVVGEVERELLAPSYRQIAIAILKNDLRLFSIVGGRPSSDWYAVLKKASLGVAQNERQLRLF